jgi:hypothetical protein
MSTARSLGADAQALRLGTWECFLVGGNESAEFLLKLLKNHCQFLRRRDDAFAASPDNPGKDLGRDISMGSTSARNITKAEGQCGLGAKNNSCCRIMDKPQKFSGQ